jgi:NADH-quinone oxidoreductase subunit L
MIQYIYLAVLLPLSGFIINGVFGKKYFNEKTAGIIGAGTIGASFAIIVLSFINMLYLPSASRNIEISLFSWINAGDLNINVSYLIDPLSLVMALIVTGVGFIIHIYSIGYMHNDPGFARFFSYMNLFIFAMMNLILGSNFLILFLGWEGVGLCSYLLIGFWYDRKFEKGTTSDAAKKAFIVNRIGDFGFLIGLFLIFLTFGSLNFKEVFFAANLSNNFYIFNLIALFLFIGATGKSAQIPLFVWLPDAMAGPTPVSALIHAATMVTAGVYMVARCSIIFASAPAIMAVIAIIGALTAIFAASIGLVQTDIKKVLAYSTISQLGYMFLALGVGAFSSGIFHVMTHAFFKALLFLGAGSVIHAMHENQDIMNYGGLKKYMPATSRTFLIAALAISGIPPFSGFFSKDEILWNAFANGSLLLWLVGVITSLLTAFYMFRLYFLTFEGSERFGKTLHPHESPKVMTIPLIALAVLSVIGGFVNIPAVFGSENLNFLEKWLEPVFANANRKLALYNNYSHTTEILLMTLTVIFALCSIMFARFVYLRRTDIAGKLAKVFSPIYRTLLNKYYVDELYDNIAVKPIYQLSDKLLWKVTDSKLIDGIVNGTASLILLISGSIRKMQLGITRIYALIMVLGIGFAILWLILSVK